LETILTWSFYKSLQQYLFLFQHHNMKNILTAVLFVVPFFVSAQDTCQLKKDTDPFTHQTKISTGFVPFTLNGVQLSISVDATSTDIDFFLWFTRDQKCFDEESTIQINFEGDRYRLNLKNTGSMNCEGAFHFAFKNSANTPPQLKRLIDKRITSFHITGANKTITDVSFSGDQRTQFARMTACVVRDSHTLLKK
jgi:hypothetical protein